VSDSGDGWLDEGAAVDEDTQIDEYDLTSSPNDFNVSTIYNFIDSGAVKIPGFQRNYVDLLLAIRPGRWASRRASTESYSR
jgi:hypothetical protein